MVNMSSCCFKSKLLFCCVTSEYYLAEIGVLIVGCSVYFFGAMLLSCIVKACNALSLRSQLGCTAVQLCLSQFCGAVFVYQCRNLPKDSPCLQEKRKPLPFSVLSHGLQKCKLNSTGKMGTEAKKSYN